MIKRIRDLVSWSLSPQVTTLPSFVVLGIMQSRVIAFWSFHVTNIEILFTKYSHQYHSLKLTFQISVQVRMTHFNIYVVVNTAKIKLKPTQKINKLSLRCLSAKRKLRLFINEQELVYDQSLLFESSDLLSGWENLHYRITYSHEIVFFHKSC